MKLQDESTAVDQMSHAVKTCPHHFDAGQWHPWPSYKLLKRIQSRLIHDPCFTNYPSTYLSCSPSSPHARRILIQPPDGWTLRIAGFPPSLAVLQTYLGSWRGARTPILKSTQTTPRSSGFYKTTTRGILSSSAFL